MKLTEVLADVYHIHFTTQRELASTFLRFQEHYESPWFKGKVFDLNTFIQWYTANSSEGQKTGSFTYYEDWHGFNIPSYVLEPFYAGQFDPLSEQEKQFLALFSDQREKRFYIIGTHKGDEFADTLLHEMAHGLWYVDETYRAAAQAIVDKVPSHLRVALETGLHEKGYDPELFVDEIHAYILDGASDFASTLDVSLLEPYTIQFRKLFDEATQRRAV
jgi:hypothetical protein